jgi:pyruvate dehydrogenase E2 component (dihydrolipoamide acetyltransferase)
MTLEFKLPDVGEGIAEGEIVQWLVAEGDIVEEHQPIVEVMTDKATVEVPAPAVGTISKLLAAEGEVVPVGAVIFHLEAASASASAAAAPAVATPAAAASTGGALIEFKLPDVGEGIAEGEIVQWLVADGDAVEEHQPIVEVMTDKATVEVPAPAAGTITKLLAEAGDVVPVGDVIFHLSTGASAPVAAPAAAPATPVRAPVAAAPARAAGEKILAVPSARRVARDLGIDLAFVAGSGRNGVVRRKDVEAFAASGATAPGAAVPSAAAAPVALAPVKAVAIAATEAETRTPFRGVRRKIAEAMTRSKFTATHFTVVEELDVTDLVTARAAAKAFAAPEGVNVTYMPFIMKAVASALAKFPQLNSALDESTQEVVTYRDANLGVATDTPNGLIVPVIPAVNTKGMMTLATELADLAGRTREGKIKPDELRGSTFTITNAGNIGGILATPILNFPEVGILGVHRIQKKPGVVTTPDGDEICVRSYMNLSISVDHRLVDGADAVRFLVHIKSLLETPALLAL